jgi:GR25 family glycosyltransferase involved in LPS biosynthesis
MKIDEIPIFILTLREYPERTASILNMLKSQGINHAKLMYGFNGKTMGLAPARQYMRDHLSNPARHQPIYVSPGVVGCAVSWFAIVKTMLIMDVPEAIVLEDDAELCPNFREEFEKTYNALPADWGIFYIGYDGRARERYNVNDRLCRFEPPVLCTHAVMLRRHVMQMIDASADIQKVDGPVDVTFYDHLLPHVPWYCAEPKLVGQLSGNELPLDGGNARLKSCM